MGGECQVRICGIRLGEVWNEVVEAAVVSVTDRPDALQELVGCLWYFGGVGDEAEPINPLFPSVFAGID